MSSFAGIWTKPARVLPAPIADAARGTLAWLDALKGIAILAVVFDHAYVVDDFLVWKHSYFAVSWFIFLAGVSNTISARRRGFEIRRDSTTFWQRRLKALLGPFLWATLLAYLVLNRQHPSPVALLKDLLLFRALPPYYFVALLLQLLAVFPLLYWALYRAGWTARLAAVTATLFVGAVVSHWITWPWVLGAHYFLGASFLYLFVLGMLAAPLLSSPAVPAWLWGLACLPVFVRGERLLLHTDGEVMTHPPSNEMVLYVVALLGLCYALCRILPRALPVRVLAALGQRSLDIFLYHYLFLLPFLGYRYRSWTPHLSLEQSQRSVVVVAIPVALLGSLLTAHLSRRLLAVVRALWRASYGWRLRFGSADKPRRRDQRPRRVPPARQ